MATYRPDGTRIRKRDKKKNRGNVGVGTSEPAGNVGEGNVGEGNVGVGTSAPPPAPEPDPEPSAPIVSDDRDEADYGSNPH